MLRRLAALSLVLLAACQNDGFRDRLAAGCRTEPECRALQAQAEARVAECAPNTIGEVRCDDARADLTVARSYVEPYDRQRAEWQAWQAQQEALRRAQEEQARAAAEAAQRQEEQQRIEAARAAALEQELAAREAACSNGNAGACTELYRLIERSPPSERITRAKAVLDKGMQQIAAREAAREPEAERARKEAEAAAAAQARPGAPASKASKAAAPAPPAGEGRVCCCDGTVSPTCTYVHKGCCSHHRGVCPCN